MREFDALTREIDTVAATAAGFMAAQDGSAWIEKRAAIVGEELRRVPGNGRLTVDQVQTRAHERALSDWHAERALTAANLEERRQAIAADIDAALTRAGLITVPDPTVIDAETDRKLLGGERVLVVESRLARRESERLRYAIEHHALTADQQLTALERAQARSDWGAAADLEQRLSERLTNEPADKEHRARFAAIRASRVSPETTAAAARLRHALDSATAAALALAIKERVAAGGQATDADIMQLFRATRKQPEGAKA